MATKLIALLLVSSFGFGCNDSLCARKSDCASGLTCSAEGLCVAESDGGSSTDATATTVDGGSQ